MNNNKDYKFVTIILLLVGVMVLTIGYSAFSANLQITSSAEVEPTGSAFNVDFSSSSLSVVENDITPTLNVVATGFTADDATISNASDPTLTGLNATFTEPGQTATYNVNAFNAGALVAYLKSITFTGSKSCSARTGTTASLVTAACNGISLSVKVGSENATTTSVSGITGHSLAVGAAETVTVIISYDSGSAQADGAFDVTLPTITLGYSSVD